MELTITTITNSGNKKPNKRVTMLKKKKTRAAENPILTHLKKPKKTFYLKVHDTDVFAFKFLSFCLHSAAVASREKVNAEHATE